MTMLVELPRAHLFVVAGKANPLDLDARTSREILITTPTARCSTDSEYCGIE